ncbi:hypothetical protein LCGC14_2805970, partial [marine sediment metagenome]
MRKIKFRGRYVFEENALYPAENKWVYGFFYKDERDCWIKDGKMSYVVIPESVGQYIGLKARSVIDQSWTDLYEGDVTEIEAVNRVVNRHVVKFGIVRRDLGTPYTLDIPSFYFDLIGGDFKAFPIVNNHCG